MGFDYSAIRHFHVMNLKFQYHGLTVHFEPFQTVIEILSVDNENELLNCRNPEGIEKQIPFKLFNLYLTNRQLTLIP